MEREIKEVCWYHFALPMSPASFCGEDSEVVPADFLDLHLHCGRELRCSGRGFRQFRKVETKISCPEIRTDIINTQWTLELKIWFLQWTFEKSGSFPVEFLPGLTLIKFRLLASNSFIWLNRPHPLVQSSNYNVYKHSRLFSQKYSSMAEDAPDLFPQSRSVYSLNHIVVVCTRVVLLELFSKRSPRLYLKYFWLKSGLKPVP
jgi:hypothetical protein